MSERYIAGIEPLIKWQDTPLSALLLKEKKNIISAFPKTLGQEKKILFIGVRSLILP